MISTNPYYWTVQVKREDGKSEKGYVLGTTDGGFGFIVGFGEQKNYTKKEIVFDSQIALWEREDIQGS